MKKYKLRIHNDVTAIEIGIDVGIYMRKDGSILTELFPANLFAYPTVTENKNRCDTQGYRWKEKI